VYWKKEEHMKPWLAWCLAATIAWAGVVSGGCGSSGNGNPDGSNGCDDGEGYCDYGRYRECRDGQYVDAETCVAPQVCVDNLGCVACNPALGSLCQGNEVHACTPEGAIGALVETCLTSACRSGSCDSGCSAESQLIYVVDNTYRLMSFNPQNGAGAFTELGTMPCNPGTSWPAWGAGTGTPFSMSVDRSARAWVLYTSGEIFWVDVRTLACQRSPFSPGASGFQLFGMGFASDTAGSESEQLYIAGGAAGALGDGDVASLDPDSLAIQVLGPIPDAEYSPELTGTGDAKLYAYFPGTAQTFVAELGKASGAVVRQWPLPPLSGTVRAWAFAHWGGKFYIFVTTQQGGVMSNAVLRLDPATGVTDTFLGNTPYVVVGAGVSTCAPVYEP
jgi:hypothetical protein